MGTKLDLLLTNWPEIIDYSLTSHSREGLFPSDHYVVDFTIMLKLKEPREPSGKYTILRTEIPMTLGTLYPEFLFRLLYQTTSTNTRIIKRLCFYQP